MSFSVLAVFGAGLATFLSPCVLPLVPVLTANLMATGSKNRWAKLLSTAWFGIGFTAAFVVMGLGLSWFVTLFPYAKVILMVLSAIVLAGFGLKMAGFINNASRFEFMTRSFQMPVFIRRLPGGLHGLFLGAGFGVSWTPCVGPILGGVLTYVATQERSLAEGTLLLTSFSFGIVIPLLLFAVAADSLLPRLRSFAKYTPKIEVLAGYGLLIFSFYMLNQAYLNRPQAELAHAEPVRQQISTSGQDQIAHAKMLFFYSDNCPVCHAMESFLPKFESDCSNDAFSMVRVNVDKVENSALAARFNVRAVPTISFLDGRGKEFIHLIGYQSEGRLREAAQSITHMTCASAAKGVPHLPSSGGATSPEEGVTCSVGNSC